MRNPSVAALLLSGLAAASACRKETPPAPPAAAKAEPPAAPSAGLPKTPAPVKGRVEVVVNDEGFVPSRIPAKAGQPIVLAITRKTERTCATEILFAGQEGKTELPLNKTVEVAYTPKASGSIKFGCAMG